MNTDEKLALFEELIEASTVLATQADQASVVLDARFEQVVRAPIDNVRDVLKRCPAVGGAAWDGTFNIDACEIKHFANDRYIVARSGEDDDPLAVGVRITHLPTGVSRESKSKNTRQENHRVAESALRQAVLDRAADQQ